MYIFYGCIVQREWIHNIDEEKFQLISSLIMLPTFFSERDDGRRLFVKQL